MSARPLLLVLALVAAPPALAADEKGKKPGPFEFPLKVGTTWVYRVGENRYSLKVTKLEKIGKQECARVEMSMGGSVVSHEHLAVAPIPSGHKEQGTVALMRYSFEGKEARPPIPLLLVPADKTSWQVNSTIAGQALKGTFRKETMKSPLKVVGKEYKDALKVWADNLTVNKVDLNITYYFVSGVGMVKQEVDLSGQKVTIELENVEFPK